jgi:hypothetical protein
MNDSPKRQLMKTFEFTQNAGEDRLVRINIPVESAGAPYHVVVHLEPVGAKTSLTFLTDEFIKDTAGKWVGDFSIEPQGDYEQREPL